MYAPTDSHWAAVKCILCYLQGTIIYDLHITRSFSFVLHGFTDADWTGNIDDRKSTGGYLVFFVRNWLRGNQVSNIQLLAPLLKLSIKP
jgi:hypothetical protein